MNIKGFGDFSKNDPPKKPKKSNDYYAGGKTSGIAVEGRDDDLEELVKQAEQ